jgi:arylsulfatase A-like enzyme
MRLGAMRSNQMQIHARAKADLVLALRLFLGVLVCLWVLDILLNLGLLEALVLHREALGRVRDFAGLLVGELQIAIGAAVAAWLVGAAIGLVLAGSRRDREAVAFLSGLMVVLVILAKTPEWHFTSVSLVRKLLVSAVAGGVFLLVAILSLGGRPTRRRSWIRWLPVLVAVLLAAHSCISFRMCGSYDHGISGARRSEDRPHIILIILDTVRADHMRYYGYSRDTMPALERWARGGLIAKRAVSPAGWTSPAHASIFSGRTVSEHGIHHVSSHGTGVDAPFVTPAFEGIPWLPDVLRDEGYHCLAVSANDLALRPEITGFDRVIVPRRAGWHSSSLAARADGVSRLTRRISERMGWRMPYVDARGIVDIAMRAVPRDDRPLFLFVNFLDAHGPYNPPAPALKELGVQPGHIFSRYMLHRKITWLWDSLPEGKAQYVADLYDGELRWVDMNLELLLRWIDERYGEDAVVIVTSDHGEELGEEGRVGHEYGLSQGMIHVPLFARGPGLGGGELGDVVSFRSLFGFICSWAKGGSPGVEELVEVDERGLVSERYPSTDSERVLGSGYEHPWVSVIEGKYKAVGPSEREFELYDIEAMGFDCEVVASDSLLESALRAWIDEYWEEFQDQRVDGGEALLARDVEVLRSLGYLQ